MSAPPARPHDPHDPSASQARPDDLGFELPPPAKLGPARLLAIGAIGVTVLAAGFVMTYLPKKKAQETLATETKQAENATLRVETVTPKLVASDRSLVLPGSVQPLEETVLYPRANGYVRKWNVDIGDHVKENQPLAEIDTPEIDSQLLQAKAQLAQADAMVLQAKANAEFSKADLSRYQALAPSGVASTQEVEQRKAQAAVDEAKVTVAIASLAAQNAEIQRLNELKAFSRVLAPFDGTVTSRTIERGALVSAGNATPLYKIAATDPVRVFVQVPQDVAPEVRSDQPAKVSVREYPGRGFEGKISRSAGALDPSTRTMNTEVRVPNPKGELLAGMFAQVALTLPSPHRAFEIPSTAILDDAKGVRVAVVGADQKVHQVRVSIERDTGPTVVISTGLDGTERVVKLASAELTEGRQVDAIAPAAPASSPSGAPGGAGAGHK